MKTKFLFVLLSLFLCGSISYAQRKTDNLNRGLVAVVPKSGSGIFLSWRVQADEYYDVTYNVYRNGTKLNSEPLNVSNYYDASGSASYTYTVKAVVKGVEESKGENAKVFKEGVSGNAPAYLSFTLEDVYDRKGNLVYCSCGKHTPDAANAQNYVINEASVADLDGDGEIELMVKRINDTDANISSMFNNEMYSVSNDRAYTFIEVYKLDGTRLWWIDCGPNMVSLSTTELNCIAYDWDMDGKAEFLMRGADNMIIHTKDGQKIYVGDPTVNTRNDISSHTDGQYAWTRTGNEYLVYLNGDTGLPFRSTTAYSDGSKYTPMTYPLLRLEAGENLAVAWGEGVSGRAYGHRASKYFMGAPYLDGRKPSLFLGRGIYTRIKMITMNVNEQHEWVENWRWNSQRYSYGQSGITSDPWYAQGYHNFVIADVDDDGRDEIVYGSMTIDDNGRGLSTSGFGHGDAMHVGDFDPFRRGMEIFSCNEDAPEYGSNFRDATTAEIIYRFKDTRDDGRCMAANVTNQYPGSVLKSSHSKYISACDATRKHEENGTTSEGAYGSYVPTFTQNFRLFWDGDLLDETMDGSETEGEVMVYKGDSPNAIMQTSGCKLVNWTKNNPTFQGDILGDWREEIIVRTADNNHIRIYSTDCPTEYRIPSLWYDHQYRNGMVTQTLVYNQPPHPSFFLGETEDITVAPPPVTTKSKLEITNNGTISSAHNGKDLLVSVSSGNLGINVFNIGVTGSVSPNTLTINTPWITCGNGNNPPSREAELSCVLSTNTVGGEMFTGNTHLVKQGLGMLAIKKAILSQTAPTELWQGTIIAPGVTFASQVWMNRHTNLWVGNTNFNGGLVMNYNSYLNIETHRNNNYGEGVTSSIGKVTVSDLILNYGSRIVVDVNSLTDPTQNDQINITGTLTVNSKNWNYGPKYQAPVIEVNGGLSDGLYPIGTVANYEGELSKIRVEGEGVPTSTYVDVRDGILYLVVGDKFQLNEPEISLVSLEKVDDFYYLPKLKIVAPATESPSGISVQPNLQVEYEDYVTGEKIKLGGGEFFSEDFESITEISGWNSISQLWKLSTDAIHGKYFDYTIGTNSTRYLYSRYDAKTDEYQNYVIEMDVALTPGNTDPVEFCVMSKNGRNPSQSWDNYATINNNANLLFDATANGNNTTIYNLYGSTDKQVNIPSDTWCHYKFVVNKSARTVDYSITSPDETIASGTYSLPNGTSADFDGVYFVAGRYYSVIKLDNIRVYGENNNMEFAVPHTGLISAKASYEGCLDSEIVTYDVDKKYAVLYESPAYNEIAKDNVAEMLGEKLWNDTYFGSRWANWSKTNTKYGENYQMVTSKLNSNGGIIYIDKDSVLTTNYVGNSYPLTLLEGFGVGHNSNSTKTIVSATNLGDASTLVYFREDISRGGTPAFQEGYVSANADGSFNYTTRELNSTFCKLVAYVPIDEEYDELSTTAPENYGTGNIVMSRAFTKDLDGSRWSTLVLPYSMNEKQIITTFGAGTMVGNLVPSSCTANTLVFDTENRVINANVPCLIRVGKVKDDNRYVFANVYREPQESEDPMVATDYFNFIGTLYDRGTVTFPENTYFFNSNNINTLSKVAKVNNTRFKGFRAYLQAAHAGVSSVKVRFVNGVNSEEETFIMTPDGDLIQSQGNVYSITGVLLKNGNTSLESLPQGIYIVNGKKVYKK